MVVSLFHILRHDGQMRSMLKARAPRSAVAGRTSWLGHPRRVSSVAIAVDDHGSRSFSHASTSVARGFRLLATDTAASAPQYSEAAFRELRVTLANSSTSSTLEAALNSIDFASVEDAEWPSNLLEVLIRLPADPRSLALLLPVVCKASGSVNQRLKVFGQYLRSASRAKAHVFLRPAVDAALILMDGALADDTLEPQAAAMRTIKQHTRSAQQLSTSSSGLKLHPVAQEEIARIVSHLLTSLQRIPSGSTGWGLDIDPASFSALLSPSLLVPGCVEVLVDHCTSKDMSLSATQWATVAAVFFDMDQPQRALECLAKCGDNDINVGQRLLAARAAKSFADAVHVLEPLLHPAQPEGDATLELPAKATDVARRAWATLTNRAAKDDNLAAKDIIAVTRSLPAEFANSFTITPAIQGLMTRGDISAAEQLWKTLLHAHELAAPSERGEYLDATALAVGAELAYARATAGPRPTNYDPLLRPLRMVDYYGARQGWGVRSRTGRVRGAVPLDTRVLNALLWMCVRAGRPGTAFTLFAAAKQRWEVLPDAVSLTLILDCARLAPDRGFEVDTLTTRLRALSHALGTVPPQQADEADWLNVETRALLPPRDAWWDKNTAAPWTRARDLFRSVVLGNWPSLARVPSPLAHGHGPLAALVDLLHPRGPAPPPPMPSPAPSPYAHLMPSSASWAAYISLLARYSTEWADGAAGVGQALGWMRALGVRPTWRCMATALWHVGENEGPRRRVRIAGKTRLARDEEVLRAWLAEWVRVVPTEEEVAAFRRNEVERQYAA